MTDELMGYRPPFDFSLEHGLIVDADGVPVDPTRRRDDIIAASRQWLRANPCRVRFPHDAADVIPFPCDYPFGKPGYTGPNRKLGDYYVREIERVGTEHRQVVRYEVVGTGRVEQMPRSRFERQARAA
jgi:hypothetical protein